MFKNPVKPSSSIDEGTVIQVDPIRLVCKVKTISGQNLDGVLWEQPSGSASRSGDRLTPVFGDRVKIDSGLGYPVITGFLPKIQTEDDKFPLSIDTGETLVDTGNYTSDGVNSLGDQSKPKDFLVGDRIIASFGGGMLAILRGGSLLLRSSRLSEIFMSKWDDMVRIVSRNWEHFTDVSTDIVKNYKGRVYRYIGYSNDFAKGKIEDYQYHQYFGDTALAESMKADYQNPGTLPSPNTVIFKEQISNDSGELMRRTLDLTGNQEVYIKVGGTFTRVVSTGSQLTFSFGDQNTITINASMIQHNFNGQQIVTIDGSKIDFVHSSGSHIVMDGAGITSTFGGGQIVQSSSGISSTFSGHFITVDGGGVHLG